MIKKYYISFVKIIKALLNAHIQVEVSVDKKDIGQLIKKRRKFLKLTQIDLSDIIGMSRRSLQMIEKGEGNPTFEQLSKILSTLGLEIKISVKRVNDV